MTAFILKPHMQRWYRAARSGGAFHPTQLPGLVALYDISDLSTLFVERTGASATTPASVDGVVGTVLDLSGNEYHVTAPSDAQRGILVETDDIYGLDLDGTDDVYNRGTSTMLRNCPGATVVLAAEFDGSAMYAVAVYGSISSQIRFRLGSNNLSWRLDDGTLHSVGFSTPVGPCVIAARLDLSGVLAEVYVNGELEVSDDTVEETGLFADIDNAAFAIGATNSGVNNMNGRVHFCALCDSPLSDTDFTHLQAYAAERVGVSL